MYYLLRLTDQSYSQIGVFNTLTEAEVACQSSDIIEFRNGYMITVVVVVS